MGLKGFVEGGIASIVAGCSTHPLDLLKVRLQLQGEAIDALRPALGFHSHHVHLPPPKLNPPARLGLVSVAFDILRQEGLAGLFSGVSATVLRQTLYSTMRLGLYQVLKDEWTDPDTRAMPLERKILAGLLAGGVGAAVGNPADVAMIRMQADGRLPASRRRNYRSAADAILRIAKSEGLSGLWRGSSLAVNRAMLVTASQLASYDHFKETIAGNDLMKDGVGSQVAASFGAGIVAAVVSNPIDVVKTRVMNMTGNKSYSGAVDCAMKTMKSEGLSAFYKGFIPTVSRQGPFTVVLFVTLEQVRKLLHNF